jgi:hypothetical protein
MCDTMQHFGQTCFLSFQGRRVSQTGGAVSVSEKGGQVPERTANKLGLVINYEGPYHMLLSGLLLLLKVKLSLCLIKHYAMKAHGSGCIDPHFLDLGTSWK